MAEAKKKTLEIVVDDGSVRVPIKNTYGDEVGEFYFRPTDVDIINRYNKIAPKFEEIMKPLENLNIAADGTAENNDDTTNDALNEAKKNLFEVCDYLFGGNMSEAFFGSMNPFSPINGVFYCETALDAVGTFIAAQFSDEAEKITKRVSKYTSKYAKK